MKVVLITLNRLMFPLSKQTGGDAVDWLDFSMMLNHGTCVCVVLFLL